MEQSQLPTQKHFYSNYNILVVTVMDSMEVQGKSGAWTYLLTNSMQQSPSWEANRFAARQEIPHNLWNPNVYYCIYICPPPVSILSQLNYVHTPKSLLIEDAS
jgi:hypothetical protein